MSLINDALKKAQRQRTPDALARPSTPEPVPAAPQPQVYVRPHRPSGPDPALIKLGAIGGAVVIVGLVAVLVWKLATSDKASPASEQAVATQSQSPAVTTPSGNLPPVVSATKPAEPTVQPQFTVRPENKPAALPTVTPATTAARPPATETPVVSAAKPDPRVLTAIDGFKVLGVRATGKESKVLMNDRVYRIGDYVVPEFGLKLTGVTPSTMTFEDSNGAIYTKSF